MRVAYYTHPAFFEPALSLIKELSGHLEIDLLLEAAPSAWQTAAFNVGGRPLPPGLVDGDAVLRNLFPPGMREYWQAAASFHLVVHPTWQSLHPQSWAISRRVLTFAAERRADVLHIDDVDVSPRLALAMPGSRRVPTVVTVHDPEPHSGERHWRKALARRLAFPRADRFILYTAASVDAFAARYRLTRDSIEVARMGPFHVFREWPSPPANVASPMVLFFGRLSFYNGLDIFYDAIRIVAQRIPRVTFVVAGHPVPGYALPASGDLANDGRLEVRDRYLSNEDVAGLFRRATVVVCPYRDASQSGVVLTAFAFGVPVVATKVGGLPEYVASERTGLVVRANDAGAVADAVCRILQDEQFAASLRRNIAAETHDGLGWRHASDALRRVYSSVAGRA